MMFPGVASESVEAESSLSMMSSDVTIRQMRVLCVDRAITFSLKADDVFFYKDWSNTLHTAQLCRVYPKLEEL